MFIRKIFEKISSSEPPGALDWWFKQTLQRLNLVTREEFDIQQAVLLKTRTKVESLTLEVKQLSLLIEQNAPETKPSE